MDNTVLTEELIQRFIADGYLVIPSVFSSDQVQDIRDSLHATMKELGFDYDCMHSEPESYRDMPRFGCQTEIFYEDFKFRIHEDPSFFKMMSQLYEATFAAGVEGFESPFAGFNPKEGYMYIDRVNCRLPDNIKPQGGLGLHVDCDPLNPFEDPVKWRPIQASVVLTDSITPSSGGLCVVPGMHTTMEEFVRRNNDEFSKKKPRIKCGNFTRLNQCDDLTRLMIPVVAPAGSIIFWDNRLPHATAEKHDGPDTREVLFMTFLPSIPRNFTYASAQLSNYRSRQAPPDFLTKSNKNKKQAGHSYQFSPLGQRLMAMEPWLEDDGEENVRNHPTIIPTTEEKM